MIVCDIKIDRRNGKWNLNNASNIDNLAYYFYLEETNGIKKKHKTNYKRESQHSFEKYYKSGLSYKKARLYIISYKINKIKEKIQKKD